MPDYATINSNTVWRIRHQPTGKYLRSGRSLHATNGRSHWATKAAAVRAWREMTGDLRLDAVLVSFKLTELETYDPAGDSDIL